MKRWILTFGMGICCLAMVGSSTRFAWADQNMSANASSVPDWIKPSDYVYSPEGKPDPFKPFIRNAKDAVGSKAKKTQRALTPLEQIEVTQLQLVGILWYPDHPAKASAMAKLPDGKGFVLRKGVKVGPNGGEVVDITPNEVLVKEEYTTIFGKQETRIVPLKLKHASGDEQ